MKFEKVNELPDRKKRYHKCNELAEFFGSMGKGFYKVSDDEGFYNNNNDMFNSIMNYIKRNFLPYSVTMINGEVYVIK